MPSGWVLVQGLADGNYTLQVAHNDENSPNDPQGWTWDYHQHWLEPLTFTPAEQQPFTVDPN